MDSAIKSERSAPCNLFIVSCPCISRATNVLTKMATLWAHKICAYVQNEFQELSDIQDDNVALGQHTDPAFIAYIKGENLHPDPYCHQTATEKVESHHFKKTTRDKNNKKAYKVKNSPACKKRSVVRRKPDLRMKPPPVEELIFRSNRSFVSTDKVSPGSTKPPHRESYGKGNFVGDHESHDCYENYTQDSTAHDSVNRKIGAEKITNHLRFPGILLVVAVVNALVSVVEKFFAHVQREWTEFNDIYGHDSADVPYTEPAFIAYLKGEDTCSTLCIPTHNVQSVNCKSVI